jgi:AcrR family transcriptional regulator
MGERTDHGRRGGQRTRERILASALDVFAVDGFDGATTRAIAARAGVNLGLIKYYFDTKEKLWRAAVDRIFGALFEHLDAAVPVRLDRREDLERLIRAVVHFAAENPAFIRLMNDEGKRGGPRMRWLTDRHGKPLYERACVLFARLREIGAVPAVADVHLFYALIGAAGLIFSQAPECRRLSGLDPVKTPAAVDAHADAIVRLLLR